ncbi:MAG TPA: DUF5666 domain-containing protein [Solirubrobacterales bacterium]|nr:DUF5666 domain-containing protein [Solirubrobacterales bacterium]
MSRKRVSSLFATSLVCVAFATALLASGAQAALRHFDGTVLSKDSSSKTLRITTEGGSKVTFKINGNTEFERIAGGFSGLRKGMSIEVDAVMSGSGLIARQIEPQSSGGDGGGGRGGNDDGPGHT